MKRLRLSLLACLLVCSATSTLEAQETLRKGPYWMDVRQDRATLMFELNAPAPAHAWLRADIAADDAPRIEGQSHVDGALYTVEFAGLEPATGYAFEVDIASRRVAHGTLTTAPPASVARVRFAVYGDNRSDAAAHHAVAEAVRAFEPEFVLNTGDMVYMGGRLDDWQSFFEEARTLYAGTPLFPVLGNHELFPRGEGLSVYRRFVRTPLADGEAQPFYRFDWGPVRVLVLDSNGEVAPGSAQRRWLDEELTRARTDAVPHLFAAMHHGPFSSGYHGPNERLVLQGLEEALREGGVELVFEGHDHLYERGDAAGLKYIVAGGGGAPLYTLDRAKSYQLAFVPTHHFVGVQVEGTRVTLETRLPDGSLLERCHFDRGQPFVCADGTPRGPVRGQQTLLAFYLGMALPWLALVGALVLLVLLARRWRRRR